MGKGQFPHSNKLTSPPAGAVLKNQKDALLCGYKNASWRKELLPNISTNVGCGKLGSYMKFVADAVDIVRGAKISMWSNFDQHDKLCLSCGSKLLHITSNFAPHGTIVCLLEQSGPNLSLLHMKIFTPHDEFTIYAAFL